VTPGAAPKVILKLIPETICFSISRTSPRVLPTF